MNKRILLLSIFAVASTLMLSCSKDIDDFSDEDVVKNLDDRHLNDRLREGYFGNVKSAEYNYFAQATINSETGAIEKGEPYSKTERLFNQAGYLTKYVQSYQCASEVSLTFNEQYSTYTARVEKIELIPELNDEYTLDGKNRIIEYHRKYQQKYFNLTSPEVNERIQNTTLGYEVIFPGEKSSPPTLVQNQQLYRNKSTYTYDDQAKKATEMYYYSNNGEENLTKSSYTYVYDLDKFGFIDWSMYSAYRTSTPPSAQKASIELHPEYTRKLIEQKDDKGNIILRYYLITNSDGSKSIFSYEEYTFTYY